MTLCFFSPIQTLDIVCWNGDHYPNVPKASIKSICGGWKGDCGGVVRWMSRPLVACWCVGEPLCPICHGQQGVNCKNILSEETRKPLSGQPLICVHKEMVYLLRVGTELPYLTFQCCQSHLHAVLIFVLNFFENADVCSIQNSSWITHGVKVKDSIFGL